MPKLVVDTREFEDAVADIIDRAENAGPVLKAWGQHMVGSVKRNFQEQGRPNPWAPLKVNTLVARFLSRAGNRKHEKAGGRFDPNPNVFKSSRGRLSAGDSSAVSTIAGFARSAKTGRVSRSRHGGFNKLAAPGMVFRRPALRAILQGQILIDTGRLRQSITSRVASRTTVEIGTNVKYAATHQYGREKIPARPFLVIQPDDEEEFGSLLTEWLSGAWGAL